MLLSNGYYLDFMIRKNIYFPHDVVVFEIEHDFGKLCRLEVVCVFDYPADDFLEFGR